MAEFRRQQERLARGSQMAGTRLPISKDVHALPKHQQCLAMAACNREDSMHCVNSWQVASITRGPLEGFVTCRTNSCSCGTTNSWALTEIMQRFIFFNAHNFFSHANLLIALAVWPVLGACTFVLGLGCAWRIKQPQTKGCVLTQCPLHASQASSCRALAD